MSRVMASALFMVLTVSGVASGASLYVPGGAPLVSDRVAHRVGDVLTVLVYQSASATNSATSNTSGESHVGGQLTAGTVAAPGLSEAANLSLGHGSDNTGTTGRSGAMVAEFGATVEKVLPNGDLVIAGYVATGLNGEQTNIRVRGEVRPGDISPDNVVISSHLANAAIDYNGEGFVSRSAQPGLIERVAGWLGL